MRLGERREERMAEQKRSQLEQEIVDALIQSQAINFESFAGIVSKYGAQAARTGTSLGVIVGRRVIFGCIPPDVFNVAAGGREVGGASE
jgi:hypothetical protein